MAGGGWGVTMERPACALGARGRCDGPTSTFPTSPRLPGVDVPGVDGDGPTSTSPAWARRLRPGPQIALASPRLARDAAVGRPGTLLVADAMAGRPGGPPGGL